MRFRDLQVLAARSAYPGLSKGLDSAVYARLTRVSFPIWSAGNRLANARFNDDPMNEPHVLVDMAWESPEQSRVPLGEIDDRTLLGRGTS